MTEVTTILTTVTIVGLMAWWWVNTGFEVKTKIKTKSTTTMTTDIYPRTGKTQEWIMGMNLSKFNDLTIYENVSKIIRTKTHFQCMTCGKINPIGCKFCRRCGHQDFQTVKS